MQAIDRIGGKADRGVEAETAGRSVDVVVDRLRHADQWYALLVELVRDGQRPIAADADERVESHLLEHLHDTVAIVERAVWRDDRFDERIASIDRGENRAAESKDPRDILRREHSRFLRIDQPIEAVLESDDRDAGIGRRFNDGSN